MRALHFPTEARLTTDLVPDIQASHGSAVRILSSMGFGEGGRAEAFNHYIKSLRKLGVPFAYGEHGIGSARRVRYSYNHLMELCLVLSLRTYGTIPDKVVTGIIANRGALYGFYRKAYLEHASGLGAPVRILAEGRAEFALKGVYLDLRIRFGGGRVIELGPPKVISPFEALRACSKLDIPPPAHLPFNLSDLAVALVRRAQSEPKVIPGSRG